MTIEQLHKKLQYLESQRIQLDNEILETKRRIEQFFPLTHDDGHDE